MFEVDEKIFAYLAGLIDGEGSIMIKKSTYRMRSPRWKDMIHPEYSPRVTMKNTNKEVIFLLKRVFGGSVRKDRKVYQGKNSFKSKRVMWAYDVHDRQAYNLVRALYPYLIIKKPQAEVILELEYAKMNAKRVHTPGFYGKPYNSETIARFEELYQKIKRLNRDPEYYEMVRKRLERSYLRMRMLDNIISGDVVL